MAVDWRRNNQLLNYFADSHQGQLRGATVIFVVGSLSISGGTNVILEYADALNRAGANVTVAYLMGGPKQAAWHPKASGLKFVSMDDAEKNFYDLAVATWWPTVYELGRLRFGRAVYFVQSLESRFSLDPEDFANESRAAATYLSGLPMITVSPWLQNLLIAVTGLPVWCVPNGIDKERFPVANSPSQTSSGETSKLRVLIEGYTGATLKAVDLTGKFLKKAKLPIELWHISPVKNKGSRHADKVFYEVSHQEMYSIYREIDVLVKMSRVEGMFGPPLEAFHAGATAIVSKVTGYSDYIQTGKNSLAVEVDDFPGMVSAVGLLSENPDLLAQLKQGALATAALWNSVDDSSKQFVGACRAILSSAVLPSGLSKRFEDIKESIEISVKSGADPRDVLPPLLVTSRL